MAAAASVMHMSNEMPKVSDEASNILVLSYNICWGCMEENTGDRTGLIVVEVCKTKPKSKSCMENIIETIDRISVDVGVPYDLVGLQEASKYNYIHCISKTLGIMNRIHALYGPEHIVSFYNPEKYTLLAVAGCDIAVVAGQETGRPMLILVLERKSDKEKILLQTKKQLHFN
jgi:hypothetical protein